MKSKVHPTYKTKYRVANWPAYNRALVRRGDVTVWVSSEAIAAWTASRSGRRGGQRRYSDLAIETALTLRLIYHLPLRQAEGFLHALFGIMRLDLSVPDYTTLYPLTVLLADLGDALEPRRPTPFRIGDVVCDEDVHCVKATRTEDTPADHRAGGGRAASPEPMAAPNGRSVGRRVGDRSRLPCALPMP